jgi:pimeloyl-ACP methyl ester carboxylesterase
MSHFTEVEHRVAKLKALDMHYVLAGSGDPVVLLHGWPQTWYEWRDVIDYLAPEYSIIAPDLRGLGDSSRPEDGYDTQTLAADVWELLHEQLKISAFNLVGHDWGGPVSYALAAAHPQAVRKLAIIDVAIPGDGAANISQGGKRWHHAFHQTLELPEALIEGREDIYLGWFYRNYGAHPDAISAEAVTEYLRTYTQPGALAAGFKYYRNIPTDVAQNEAIVAKFKLPMPVLALGGAQSWGRRGEVLESCQRVATDVRGGIIENAGHWIPEEQPEVLSERLREFFAS